MTMGGPTRYVIDVCSPVSTLSFSPYEWSGSLLAVGTDARITIFSCTFPEEDPSIDDFEYEQLRDFHHGCRVLAISWSPQTTLKQLPKELKFVTAGSDRKLRYFFSDLKEEDNVVFCEGHSDHINDVALEPNSGEDIASVSDDYTCRLWTTDGQLKTRFQLTSPGMSVSWHRSEPGKLMVAEKKGLIRFYNVSIQQPFLSFDCSCIPLMCARWCPSNSIRMGAVAGTDWFLWKVSSSSRPLEHKTAHPEGAALMEFSLVNHNIFATRNCKGNQVKVINPRISQPMFTAELTIGHGLSWHHKFQVLAVGGDCKVHLWKIANT